VSPTAVAARLPISESRPVLEVVAELTATEFKQVVDIVAAIADHFLTGTLASLESQRSLPQPEPAMDISTDAASGRPAVQIKPDAEAKRPSAGLRGSRSRPSERSRA
jgi:hypothetical protein